MILFAHPDKSQITDFIMWADVEFAMQLQIMETRDFANQAVTIIDLGEADRIAGLAAGEPLFVLCHGSPPTGTPAEPKCTLQGKSYTFLELGGLIGARLPAQVARIELWACYAAAGTVGSRAIDRFAAGVRRYKTGVTIKGYAGATVTNTMATIAAREASAKTSTDPVLVVANSRTASLRATDATMRATYMPQLAFDSYLQATPDATPRQKAIQAAAQAEGFYAAFSATLASDGVYYGMGSNLSRPVRVRS